MDLFFKHILSGTMLPSSNNNTTNAAVQAAAKAEREEKLRGALKSFILTEKQRKKEFEAKLEEDRLRKEREAREIIAFNHRSLK